MVNLWRERSVLNEFDVIDEENFSLGKYMGDIDGYDE